ncbi:MAG TPA: serine hydrolase domain-containing protein [Nocardioides sp.]|uniref:serine hydrolase domain-containing protein n=1 Tax=Nocardioides sp. TaxID=35761 RepID=UPI002BF7BF62|nr:serine hydrolase domain-containing protein [Nocardioides sp.]HQR25759.1 serine hydrolase domain-containing protein [Nocardioides sp.]
MSRALPRSTPAAQHVDPAAVLAFVDAVEADPDVELHSLMVLRHGHVVTEGWWAPHTPERTRLLYSLSKSFTSTALGFALSEGLLALDDPVVAHFPELADEVTDPRSRSITVRHVASMASGHDRDMWVEALARDPEDPVRGFLLLPPDDPPGTRFAYNQPCTYTLASIIQRAAGTTLSGYLRPRLLDPLGIGEVAWRAWPTTLEQGFSGLFARTEDVAKLGLLYLQRGRWGDTRLLPEEYVALATSRQVGTPAMENVDWRQGYGFQFWMARHGYRGDGAFGQFCLVLPEHDTVVATTGGTEAMQAVLDLVWTHLLPGLRPAGDPVVDERTDQERLDQRLRSLALPAFQARSGRTGWEDWADSVLAVPATTDDGATALTGIGLHREGDRLEVTLHEPDNALTVPVGNGEWLTSAPCDRDGDPVPVATSGGWLDEDTLRVEVVFLETPHRLDLTCSLPTRSASASWRHVPLDGGRLRTLHRPRRPAGER